MKKIRELINIDAPPVTNDEAVELTAHHLSLAASYFEATPRDFEQVKEEVLRILAAKNEGGRINCAKEWLERINEYYEALRKEQGD